MVPARCLAQSPDKKSTSVDIGRSRPILRRIVVALVVTTSACGGSGAGEVLSAKGASVAVDSTSTEAPSATTDLPSTTSDLGVTDAITLADTIWVGVILSADSPNDFGFEREVADVQLASGDAFGRDIQVSPVGCFGGLQDELEAEPGSYVIVVRSESEAGARDLLATVGVDADPIAVKDFCVD